MPDKEIQNSATNETDRDQTIYFTRHGEGYHQGEPQEECENIRDAELNDKGRAQCRHLCDVFPFHDKIDLIVASPLRRAIQTALIGYKTEIDKGMKVLLMPDLQEVSDQPMDIGSSQKDLEKQFGDKLDYSQLYEGWEIPSGKHATDTDSLLKRGQRMRAYLKERPERNIMVVFHGSFVHYVTGNLKNGEKVGDAWQNASWRMYDFQYDPEIGPILVQKPESKPRTLPGQARARDDVGE